LSPPNAHQRRTKVNACKKQKADEIEVTNEDKAEKKRGEDVSGVSLRYLASEGVGTHATKCPSFCTKENYCGKVVKTICDKIFLKKNSQVKRTFRQTDFFEKKIFRVSE
jgi:hypothetical protein